MSQLNWEQEYGKPPSEMDDGEFRMAVLSKLAQLTGCMSNFTTNSDRFEKTCNTVNKHSLYWQMFLWIFTPFALAGLGILIKLVFHI